MSTPIAADPKQWFDGLRPDVQWQLPDPLKPGQPPEASEPRAESCGTVPKSNFGQTPPASRESIEAFMQRVGISGGPAPVFGTDDEGD